MSVKTFSSHASSASSPAIYRGTIRLDNIQSRKIVFDEEKKVCIQDATTCSLLALVTSLAFVVIGILALTKCLPMGTVAGWSFVSVGIALPACVLLATCLNNSKVRKEEELRF